MGMHKNEIPKVNKSFLSGVATLELSKTVMYIKKIWKQSWDVAYWYW